MEQRDYILREIEKISVLILGLIARLREAKAENRLNKERDSVSEEFESSSDVNIYKVIGSDLKDLPDMLSNDSGFDFRNMELMADLLIEFSTNMDEGQRRMAIEKSVFLLELVDRESKVFSFERQIKINELKLNK
jgi:hypothetical protein